MRPVCCFLVCWLLAASARSQEQPNRDAYYRLGPDSLEHEGVPRGELLGPRVLPCKVFPGTQHTYWVYVPAQYKADEPTALMLFQDGQAFVLEDGPLRARNVLDNLIHRREIPVMIAVFINPGRTPEQPEPTMSDWGDRNTNRPEEYNALNDKYARVLVDEFLPKLRADYNLSDNPEHRGVGGISSGAIAAFTAAWQRPDQFRKVLSIVGSYTNIRGGHRYPDLIRDAEPKPLRVFLHSGRNDNRGRRDGRYDPEWDWFLQNTRMAAALEDRGYDVTYVWGIGAHGSTHGGAILPEMMRWLWRDHGASTDPDDAEERAFNVPGNKN